MEDPSPQHSIYPSDPSTSSTTDPPLPSFLHGSRPFRDLPALLLFLLLSLSSFSIGIFSLLHRNPHSGSHPSFDPSTSACNYSSLTLSSSSAPSSLLQRLVPTLAITLLLSPLLTLFLLSLLRRFPKHLLYVCLPLFPLLPSFLNIYWFVFCTLSPSCRSAFPLAYRILLLSLLFILIALLIWILVANWHRVDLTIRIVSVAARALSENLGLFVVLPLLALGAVAYVAPIVVFLVFAPGNGVFVPRETSGSEEEGVYECVWRQDRWVPAYFALGIVTVLWTLAMVVEAQVYVISGTVAQWYFAYEGVKPARGIRNSLSHAFGPSFGTVCFSGLAMGLIRIIRAIIDAAEREDAGYGIVNLFLQCCANSLLSGIHFVNKFTINFAAITGEGYCSAARMTYELLKRNLLSTAFVETISTRILAGIIFVVSGIYAIVVCAILKAASSLKWEAYVVAALAWVLLFIILGYFVHVLDNVVDTVYICFAIDRDKGEVSKQEVHEVYAHLPISRTGISALSLKRPLLA